MNIRAARAASRILSLPLVLLAFAATPVSAVWMAEYFPLCEGATWILENLDEPGEFCVDTVLEYVEYEGHTAMRFGEDLDDHSIVGSDGQTVTLYAQVDEGVLHDLSEDLVLGDLSDGDHMVICVEAPCDTNMIRFWQALDPGLRSIYGLEPEIEDMLMIVSYDPAYAPNLHNTVLESNLPGGVTPPAGAVTEIEWYARHAGTYALFDVDAPSGGLYDRCLFLEFVAPVTDEGPPARAELIKNVPNPFNPTTEIRFELSRPGAVTLLVHDCAGRRVRTLADGLALGPGPHAVTWDGRDETGRDAPSGTYVCRLIADGTPRSRLRMTLVR